MSKSNLRRVARLRRKARVRRKVQGTSERPRLNVFRSAAHIYAQLIDDTQGVTLAACSTLTSAVKDEVKGLKKTEAAKVIGTKIAEAAKAKGIEQVVFDRNGFLYHGRLKALSEAAREAGLKI